MEMIQAYELSDDQVLATRILATARSIAPGLDSLLDDARAAAVVILRGIVEQAQGRGTLLIRSERTLSAGVDYAAINSWFTEDDRAALRHLCAAATASDRGPAGDFPHRSRLLRHLWPQHEERHGEDWWWNQ